MNTMFSSLNTPDNKRVYLSASATVEAALVIPIYIYAVLTVIFLLQIIAVKSRMSQAIYNDARELAAYSYVNRDIEGGDVVTKAMAYAILVKNLGMDYAVDNNIVGGNAGLSLINSKFLEKNNDIELIVNYSISNPFDMFGIGVINIQQGYKAKAWLGETANSKDLQSTEESKDGKKVYICKDGEVYHSSRDCTYLKPTISLIRFSQIADIRNNSGGKYYQCEKCCSNVTLLNTREVYITNYGDRYHSSDKCSFINRTIIEILLKNVGDRRPCSKCYGG